MGYQQWIPDQLARYGVPTRLQPGWETRGSSGFNPRGLVIHHDAYHSTSSTSSILNTMTNGRSDLPGPLCHVWIDDDADDTGMKGDPVAYVIAAGVANHAGSGGWKGLSGNSSVLGIEARNAGTGEAWSPAMLDCYSLVCAALLDGIQADTSYMCGHKEWTTRKIDPNGIEMNGWRNRVSEVRATGGHKPEAKKDEPMFCLVQPDNPGAGVYRFDGAAMVGVPNPTVLGGDQIVLAALGLPNQVLVVSKQWFDSWPVSKP